MMELFYIGMPVVGTEGRLLSCVGARKVSPNWSLETMTCHSSHCFSIIWGQGNATLVTFLPGSCYMTLVARAVYGHVITKFSRMGRLT